MEQFRKMYFYIKHYFTGCPENDIVELYNGAMGQCTKCERKCFIWK